MMAYVLDNTAPLPATELTELLFVAGSRKHLTTAQVLRQHGAPWPAVLRRREGKTNRKWNDTLLAWARAEGCSSPDGREQ
jgi:hypothetical protein